MKTQIVYVFLFLLCLPLHAQTEKGKWLFSPLTFRCGWAPPNGEAITQQANYLSFKLLYFASDRLAFGAQCQHASNHVYQKALPLEEKSSWWLMPTVRYYVSGADPEKPLKTFVEAGGTSFYDRDQADRLKEWGGIAGIGLDYFLNEQAALELIVAGQYRSTSRETAAGDLTRKGVWEPNLQLGLRFFLQPSFFGGSRLDLEQARWLVGAWIDLDADDDGALNRHPFFVRGRAAYFIAPRLATGLEGGIDLGGNKLSALTIFSDWECTAFMRYYLPAAKNIQFFPEAGYGMSEHIYEGVQSSKARTFKAGVGAQTALSPHFSLEALCSYRRHQFLTDCNEPTQVPQNSLGLELNLTYFLFR